MGDNTRKLVAHELVESIRASVIIEWNLKESVLAQMRTNVRRLLAKHDYRPDLEEKAVELVLEPAGLSAHMGFRTWERQIGGGTGGMVENSDADCGATNADSVEVAAVVDPRALLAEWANDNEEWVRYIVGEVIATGCPLADSRLDQAYQLFRQENALDERVLPYIEPLTVESGAGEKVAPLAITRLFDVKGVNALTPGAKIEPHEGLTILYGENGTGKTGYSRIFKALADSRTADYILGDIKLEDPGEPSASVAYTLDGDSKTLDWEGERGVAPFTRMVIFDSPSVSYHVDDDLEYVYVPAALALFNHVIAEVRGVQERIDQEACELKNGDTTLLARFPKESTVYPFIETLGAATDLESLKVCSDAGDDVDERIDGLRQAIAALEANTIATQITLRQREVRVLTQAATLAEHVSAFAVADYNGALARRQILQKDYDDFRRGLFGAADLPAEPEETWATFIVAGDEYRRHLDSAGVHDPGRCLYCRQDLSGTAHNLINRYANYLDDKISSDLAEVDRELIQLTASAQPTESTDLYSYIGEYQESDDKADCWEQLVAVTAAQQAISESTGTRTDLEPSTLEGATEAFVVIRSALDAASQALQDLEAQSANRPTVLAEKRSELVELEAAAELARSWSMIESQVTSAKEADRLSILKSTLPNISRSLTALSKEASDRMINQRFDALFAEECTALRAPDVRVQFVGRQGKAQRRKVLSGQHIPSKVLSEGEQKVLAMADFLAEARLAGITAPVIFDDPVSSLDHRRIDEVAQRVVSLASSNQVIVFTHDIFFATTLLSLCEKSKKCIYYQVSDEDGKGNVTRATGPRWDTLKSLRAEVNKTIDAAKGQEGEARAALVRTGYDWIRAWCEVFTETELLKGVTQRYQPNVGMTRLANINTERLPELIETVTEVFERACRYIDGHSQPLPTLGVSPTLKGLEEDWTTLQQCAKVNDGKA